VKRSFTIVVECDAESRWLVGEVVELPGCYTQTPDRATSEANIRKAIRVYFNTGV
jgi:predicted RNase H-like HicB family nuclease